MWPDLHPQTVKYLSAMTVQPSIARVQLIDTLMRALDATNAFAALDALYLFKSHDRQAAKLNVIAPHDLLIETGTATFTTDAGVVGNNSNYWTMATNMNDLPKTALNSRHIGIFIGGTDSGNQGWNDVGVVGNTGFNINAKNSNNVYWQPDSNVATAINFALSPNTSVGHIVGLRNTNATNTYLFKSGVNLGGVVKTNVALPAAPFSFCRGTTAAGRVQFAAHCGAALSSASIAAIDAALTAYFAAF